MSESLGKTIAVSMDMHIPGYEVDIWPLLCPVREYDWIETWDCRLIQSRSGVNELGCVFVTDFPTECGAEVWITTRYEPYSRLEFVRTNSARIIRLEIALFREENGTRLTWVQHVTSLNAVGDEYIAQKPQAFARQMSAVEKMLGHYLRTGKKLKGEEAGLVTENKDHVHSGKAG
ncbi:hypothetical protein GM415_06750 [Pseudodesulfovibrio cashew]|uniref:SRPBCC family protein n=1 Tax=Pseudodesulfovibrio cashew TaxID=2678688 RepID=A0A6I6JHK2_9BACT|nr:hypothetical protein [Pseudodesulfovibrio cashew]QGY39832.1 hypothetical protein GM415_06750 [Pseudodesulfovibrio cashew]